MDTNRTMIGPPLKRIDLLTKQDIANIKRSFKLDIVEGVKHSSDAISLDLWVLEQQKKEDNPVLFYKQQNEKHENFQDEDFCLIVMNKYQKHMLISFGSNVIATDSTHGLNGYDFELTTVMVVDEFGEGFPIAFMFTNRKDTFVHTFFFKRIKEEVGGIETKTFMSDITSVFYSAWISTMGHAKHQLYCSWHIDRAWQSNLMKIKNKEKRNWVYKTLKILQNYLDTSEFHEKLVVFINELLEDTDTSNFGDYFQRIYGTNFQQWAYCYHKYCGINTNMRLESMHRTIKYFYLNKKCTKRLDEGLHAVMMYLRDKIVDRIIKHTKGKQNIHKKEILKRHRAALVATMKANIVCKDKSQWIVSNNNTEYYIEKCPQEMQKCCNLICDHCNICVHDFTCSCPDFLIKTTICKHIHFLILEMDKNKELIVSNTVLTSISQEPADNTSVQENINICLSSLENAVSDTSIKNMKETISNEISAIHGKINTLDFIKMTPHYYSQILSNLSNISGFLDMVSASNVSEKPPQFALKSQQHATPSSNMNIVKQKRFHSTKKTAKGCKRMKKANLN